MTSCALSYGCPDFLFNKAIFTSKGALMVAGNARRITVAVNAMDNDAQNRDKAIELARGVLDQL
jgi:hypothetical protein